MVIGELGKIVYGQIPAVEKYDEFPSMPREDERRAMAVFIYDLTEPANKQTTLQERTDFKNHHIYHFAAIDLPYSFSNIVILEVGRSKIFRAVKCESGADKIEDVLNHLSARPDKQINNKELISRITD